MLPEHQRRSFIFFIGIGFVAYSLFLTVFTGDAGFEGDDWWVLSRAYWNSFPTSIMVYAKDFLRPVEGVYWMSLFEIFGFNRIAFHLASLLLLSASVLLMATCLNRAFPERRSFTFFATLFSFFMPMLSCLTYVMCTDNSRLSLVLFWAAVTAFQVGRGSLRRPFVLLAGAISYLCAFFTYEATSFLIFSIPLLVYPIHRADPGDESDRVFLIRISAITLTCFLIAVGSRFVLLSGGAVGQKHLIPPLDLILAYFALIPMYLAEPFRSISSDPISIGISIIVFSCFALVIRQIWKGQDEISSDHEFTQSSSYLLLLGIVIVVFGMAPYQLAGYGGAEPRIVETALVKWGFLEGSTNWYNFNWSSRIYSAAAFGIAVILACAVTMWRGWIRYPLYCVAGVTISLMAGFHTGLSVDWQRAAQDRSDLVRSVLSIVPEVRPKTNFVLLGLESYDERAAVFRGWAGLRELFRILYGDPNVNAWYLFPENMKGRNQKAQQAIVMDSGFVSRGMDLRAPAPHESLIILNRVGNKMVIVDEITSNDELVTSGITWRDASAIRTNYDKISGWSPIEGIPAANPERNISTTGLIFSLNLLGIKPNFDMFVRTAHSAGAGFVRKHFFERMKLANRKIVQMAGRSSFAR